METVYGSKDFRLQPRLVVIVVVLWINVSVNSISVMLPLHL